jgi:hypothetical protein
MLSKYLMLVNFTERVLENPDVFGKESEYGYSVPVSGIHFMHNPA